MCDGRIYKIFEKNLSWFDAYSYCAGLGGHLVTITSAVEQTFIELYMNSVSLDSRCWIGGYNDGDSFKWVTDEEFDYTNWYKGEPNNQKLIEFFGEINYEEFGKWNDLPPQALRYLICEWEAAE